MTEAEWLTYASPTAMLMVLHFQNKASERKWRLLAVACCKRIWPLLTNERSRRAVELWEHSADHPVSNEELQAASKAAYENMLLYSDDELTANAARSAALAAAFASYPYLGFYNIQELMIAAIGAAVSGGIPFDAPAQADLLHDVFDSAFRRLNIQQSWLKWNDESVRELSQAIYDDRAFDRLPILADALEDAGCDNADILTHCRSGGEHVRGCWVVDLLLGKC